MALALLMSLIFLMKNVGRIKIFVHELWNGSFMQILCKVRKGLLACINLLAGQLSFYTQHLLVYPSLNKN